MLRNASDLSAKYYLTLRETPLEVPVIIKVYFNDKRSGPKVVHCESLCQSGGLVIRQFAHLSAEEASRRNCSRPRSLPLKSILGEKSYGLL